MEVRGIRYGKTEGMSYIPVGAPKFVEVMVYDNEGNSSFILSSLMNCNLEVIISDYPVYDIAYNAFLGRASNFDSEWNKVDKLIKEQGYYDLYDDEPVSNGYGHNFPGHEKAVDLSIFLLNKLCFEGLDDSIIDKYLFADIDDMEIPYIPFVKQKIIL